VAAERLIPIAGIICCARLVLNSLPVSQSRQMTVPFPGYVQTNLPRERTLWNRRDRGCYYNIHEPYV
jgi:hypothetical protein